MGDPKGDDLPFDWQVFLRLRADYRAARDRLIAQWLPWAHAIANRAHARMPARVNVELVRSEAALGLIQAVDRYEGGDTPFPGFARLRVTGAIVDWVREEVRLREFSLSDLAAELDSGDVS